MTSDPRPDYTLSEADANTFCTLLRAQTALGPAQTSPGQAQFWAFFAALDVLAYPYGPITNTQLKGWTDKPFAALLQTTQTCYGTDAAGLYVLYSYAQFSVCCSGEYNRPSGRCGRLGYPNDYRQRGGMEPTWDMAKGLPMSAPWDWFATAVGLWKPPGARPDLFKALNADVNNFNDALKAAGHSTPTIALVKGWNGTCPDWASVVRFEQSLFDPKNWTDSQSLVKNLAGTGLWQEQSQAFTSLLKLTSLNSDAYFFLLHLLIALGTSTSGDQQAAQKLVSAIASSPEYPNDTFINQLVYLVLMYLADPMGNFAWTNAELQAEMSLLEGLVVNQDPASQAIRTSLAQHQRVRALTLSYPMQDPYAPGVGFTQRVSDTLFALDKARYTPNQ